MTLPEAPPMGPEADATPRPLPARVPIRGQHVSLEPLHRRHAAEPWQAATGADASWTYLGHGPFASRDAMARHAVELAGTHDPANFAADGAALRGLAELRGRLA